MSRKNLNLRISFVLLVCITRLSAANLNQVKGCEETVPSGCTVFTISKGEQVFFGGNDDYIHPDSYYWVDPGDDQNYGAIWIGQPDNVQQGVNEQGLAYDANGLPRMDANPHSERIPVAGGYTSYPIQVLHECATVEEVITWVNSHQWHSYMHDQMHFADATGDAVIISAGTDGEVVFTRKTPGDGFLVSTNFNVAHPANGYGHPCWRYDRAQELLTQLVNEAGQLTAKEVTNVLDAVHLDGGASWTISSLLADLPNGVVYLYFFHQFDRPVVLNVEEEIANPRTPGPLSRLFPDDTQQEAVHRFQRIEERAKRCWWVGIGWPALVLASLIVLIALSIRRRQGLRFWVPAVILLGPLGLLVWFVASRDRQPDTWRVALMEAVGDVMPTVFAFVASLVISIQVPAVQGAWPLQVLIVFCLPLVVGWLIFQGPLLSSVTEQSYGRFLSQRLLPALVAANLGMAGINLVAMPLVNQSIRVCSVLPLSARTVMTWWAIVVVGALVGGLLLSFYESWAVGRGFQAWSVLASSRGEVRSPSWRELWWWILLSYVALLGGLASGVILQQLLTV